MTTSDLLKLANNTSIPIIEYIGLVEEGSFSHVNELIIGINTTRSNTNGSALENILILASRDGLNTGYTAVLCKTLEEQWHHSHEDIVMMLEEIKDPTSVNTLYNAAINIPYHDDGRSLAKKCIWALGAINTEEAKKKLKLLKEHEDSIISEAAATQLE